MPTNKKGNKKEFRSDFFLDQLDTYHQDWLNGLIKKKVEYLHCTHEKTKNMITFQYTYNIFLHNSVYQVMVTHNQIKYVKQLYKNVKKNKKITYQSVNEPIIKDKTILEEIKGTLNKMEMETV